MVELLATIAILAILTAITITFVGNYVTYAKKNVDKQNLYILNDALTRYKTQGGNLSALTLGAPIGNIIGLLQTPVTWAGMRHQFMRSGKTFDPTTIKAAGEGATYRFYVYDDYTENAPALGEATSDMPYGQGYGYVEVSGIILSPGFHMGVVTDSGYWALLPDGESVPTITASNLPNLNKLYAYNNSFSSITLPQGDDWSSLIEIDVGDGNLTSLDVSHIPSLIRVYCINAPLASLSLPNQSMREIYVAGVNSLTSTTENLNEFYTNELPDISGTTGAGGLFIGDGAPAGTDSLATAKGWTVIRADW